MNKQFEYHVVDRAVPTHELTKLGMQGWELVSITRVINNGALETKYTFKREIENKH